MSESGRFPTTSWSIVLAAGATSTGRPALEALCAAYWRPVYAFVRRMGHDPETAEDLTQSFFALLVERRDWEVARRERGRFRSFLLTCVKHFLSNEWDRAQAQKRGGGIPVLPLTLEGDKHSYCVDPVDTVTPDRLFERCWAETMVRRVLERLRDEQERAGRGAQFQRLKPLLTAENDVSQREIAAAMGLSQGAVKMAVLRLRRRYKELLSAEIAETLDDPAAVPGEMRFLLAALQKS
jgi:RNA polymerase sigma factor (sigma-70 family)